MNCPWDFEKANIRVTLCPGKPREHRRIVRKSEGAQTPGKKLLECRIRVEREAWEREDQ